MAFAGTSILGRRDPQATEATDGRDWICKRTNRSSRTNRPTQQTDRFKPVCLLMQTVQTVTCYARIVARPVCPAPTNRAISPSGREPRVRAAARAANCFRDQQKRQARENEHKVSGRIGEQSHGTLESPLASSKACRPACGVLAEDVPGPSAPNRVRGWRLTWNDEKVASSALK